MNSASELSISCYGLGE